MSSIRPSSDVPGRLAVFDTPSEVALGAANEIAAALRLVIALRKRATLALSGGNTPRAAYALLAKAPDIDWGVVDVFWVDERSVPKTDERSNFRHADAMLLRPAKVPESRTHRMKADAIDLEAAARSYERELTVAVPPNGGGIPAFDVMVLGVGDDAHTASLFPGEAAVANSERLVLPVPAKGEREARLTLTPPVIKAADRIFVLAVGAAKRRALQSAWDAKGDVQSSPIRVVRHAFGEVVWLVDRSALGR